MELGTWNSLKISGCIYKLLPGIKKVSWSTKKSTFYAITGFKDKNIKVEDDSF